MEVLSQIFGTQMQNIIITTVSWPFLCPSLCGRSVAFGFRLSRTPQPGSYRARIFYPQASTMVEDIGRRVREGRENSAMA